MPSMNELGGGEGVNQILSRRFEIQGAPAPMMASELFPMVVLEDDRPEWKYLANEKYAVGYLSEAAAVGNYSIVQLDNPASSGAILVVEQIELYNSSSAVQVYAISLQSGSLLSRLAAQTYQGMPRDSRFAWDQSSRSVGLMRSGISASLLQEDVMRIACPPSTQYSIKVPWVLGPDTVLSVAHATTNTAASVGFYWRERAATRAELRT